MLWQKYIISRYQRCELCQRWLTVAIIQRIKFVGKKQDLFAVSLRERGNPTTLLHDPHTGNNTSSLDLTNLCSECPDYPTINTEEHPYNITSAPSSTDTADTPTSPGAGAEGREGESEAPTMKKAAESRTPCSAVGGALGVLCVVLAALLVGVVMGWVWSCRNKARNKER